MDYYATSKEAVSRLRFDGFAVYVERTEYGIMVRIQDPSDDSAIGFYEGGEFQACAEDLLEGGNE